MKESENVRYYTDQDTIGKIIEVLKRYSYDSLKKREPYFSDSLMEKNTDENFLRKIYPDFHRIKLIALRKRENGRSSYDIYYELDDGSAVLYAIDLDSAPPILINAFVFSKSLKNFIRYIVKKYGKEMI